MSPQDQADLAQLALIWAASSFIFYRAAYWYWYDLKQNQDHNRVYRMEGLFAWLSPIWPILLLIIIMDRLRYKGGRLDQD